MDQPSEPFAEQRAKERTQQCTTNSKPKRNS